MHYVIEEDCRTIVQKLSTDLAALASRTILMTGFAGFLGSYITSVFVLANRTLLKGRECTFIGLDNFSRGKPEWVLEIEKEPHVEILSYDISRPLPHGLENREINYIIHGASIASPTYYRLHPIETMDANVEGLRNLLRYSLAHKNTLRSFLFFSSSEVYGDPAPENIPTPETHQVRHVEGLAPLARHLGYPVVVKPLDGVGCQSVFIARQEMELRRAFTTAARETGQETLIVQPYIEGVHASVSLLTDGVRSLPLTLNLQEINGRTRLTYRGGRVPLDHPLRSLAFRRAAEVVKAIPGLKGYVGIDLVLTDRDVVVIEVNPRLTTSYVGIRMILHQNLAALIIDAVRGKLPEPGQIQIAGTATFTTRSCEGVKRRSQRWFG